MYKNSGTCKVREDSTVLDFPDGEFSTKDRFLVIDSLLQPSHLQEKT